MPLTTDEPPSPRPRMWGRGSWVRVRRDSKPIHWYSGSVSSSARQPFMLRTWIGACADRQSDPASSSTTCVAGSPVRRAATTHPALPPPTTTKSASIVIPLLLCPSIRLSGERLLPGADQRLDQPLRIVEARTQHRSARRPRGDALADDCKLE